MRITPNKLKTVLQGMKNVMNDIPAGESELLPCPFCNVKPITESMGTRFEKIFRITCDYLKCPVVVRTGWPTSKEDAIKAWNTRANKAEKILAELKEWLDEKNNRPLTKHYTNSEYFQGQMAMLKCFTDKLKELSGG